MGRKAIAPTSADEVVVAILDARRKELGLTQGELAALTDGAVSQSSIDRYFRAEVSMPLAALMPLCKALGLSLGDVIRDAGL